MQFAARALQTEGRGCHVNRDRQRRRDPPAPFFTCYSSRHLLWLFLLLCLRLARCRADCGTSVAARALRRTMGDGWRNVLCAQLRAVSGGTCFEHNCGWSVAARALRTTVDGQWRHVLCAELWENWNLELEAALSPCVPEVLGSNPSWHSCYPDLCISWVSLVCIDK
jgi:hypothetical protein